MAQEEVGDKVAKTGGEKTFLLDYIKLDCTDRKQESD